MPDLFTLLNNFYNHFGSYCETFLYTLDAKRLEATQTLLHSHSTKQIINNIY